MKTRLPIVVFIAALLAGTAGNVADGFNEDELQHLHAAWLVGQGQIPYRDYFDHHPPLFHFAAAPIMSAVGTNYILLFAITRLLAITVAVGCALLFSRLTPKSAGRSVMLLSGALVVVSRPSDILFYFRPDSIAMLLVLAAVAMTLSRRRPALSALASGACLGTAVFFTQKVLALAPAFLIWNISAIVQHRAGRKEHAVRLGALIAGIAIPVCLMLAWLAHYGVVQGFLEGPIGFGAHWHQPDGWRKFAQEPVLLGFGTVVLGVAWAIRSLGAWLKGDERWPGDALLALLAVCGLAGFLRTPAPTPQAYFMTVHVWLLACAVRLITAWTADETAPVTRTQLIAGIVGALALLNPTNGLAAAFLWGGVYFVWRAVSAKMKLGRKSIPAIAALGTVAVVVFCFTQADRLRRGTAVTQIRSLEEIDRLIPPGGQVLTTWPILTPARPHATYHWFSDIGMYTSMPRGTLQTEYLNAMADRKTVVVVCDPSVIEKMVPAVWTKLRREFLEADIPPDGLRGGHVFVRLVGGQGRPLH